MLTPQEVQDYFERAGAQPVAARGDWRDAKCPFHDDRSRSFTFNVKSGGWKCQAGCGGGGLKEMADRSRLPLPAARKPAPRPPKAAPSLVCAYDYHDAAGALAYQVLRYAQGAAKTFRQRRPDGAGGWVWKMEGVAPLPYRLPALLAAAPAQPVFVVEGEKDADNLTALGLVATTNHGGAGKWRAEHAAHLKGKTVVIIPDHDEPGRRHAQLVGASLRGVAAQARVLALPDLPEKGDVSDWLAQGGTAPRLLELAGQAPLWTPAPTPGGPAAAALPFVALGYDQSAYYYLNRATNQVASLIPNHHAKLYLLSMAPLDVWAKAYGGENGQVAWATAASDMMAQSAKRGVFDHSRIRGRGAWHERDQPVVHLGDKLVVAGEQQPLGRVSPQGFIYPAAVPMPIKYDEPLADEQSAKLIDLCLLLNWERPISSQLLAGWIAVAPICGALSWRPHIWITGAAGTGKSWVMDHLMRPILDKTGLFVQSETTEAGIRQALGYDARPVLFDEAEGESERSQIRMQNVLALMRQSSSENGSVIAKGTGTGQVKVYSVRSCFALSSIGVGTRQHSDATRVTVLSMTKSEGPEAKERFELLEKLTLETVTPQWIEALHARMIKLIPVVRANARTFAAAGAVQMGSQRMGDQIGALLAGTYALGSTELVTLEAAQLWMAKQDWSEQATVKDASDEFLCLNRIMQHVIRVQDKGGMRELSVAEMIESCDGSMDFYADVVKNTLLRHGLRVENDHIVVANQHSGIGTMLSGTPWTDWGRILRRIPGAKPTPGPTRFMGVRVRGTIIPKDVISN